MGSAVVSAPPAILLTHRPVRIEDADLLWQWANDPATRRNSFHHAAIPYADHLIWLQGQLDSPTTRFWIFGDLAGPIGQVRCTMEGATIEIHISVAPERRSQGYGKQMLTQALSLARKTYGDRVRIRASILGRNTQSLRLFQSCGFRAAAGAQTSRGEHIVGFELPLPEKSDKGG